MILTNNFKILKKLFKKIFFLFNKSMHGIQLDVYIVHHHNIYYYD